MSGNREDFEVALQSLSDTLTKVIEPQISDERARLLLDLLRNQLLGMEMFYRLLLLESGEKFMLDDEGFDLLTQKYRRLLRFFTRFPGADEKSLYEMLIVGDFYYLMSSHASAPGA